MIENNLNTNIKNNTNGTGELLSHRQIERKLENRNGKDIMVISLKENIPLKWMKKLTECGITDFLTSNIRGEFTDYEFNYRGQKTLHEMIKRGQADDLLLLHLFDYILKKNIAMESISLDFIWIDENYGIHILPPPYEMNIGEMLCAAPEQIMDGKVDAKSTVFLLAGQIQKQFYEFKIKISMTTRMLLSNMLQLMPLKRKISLIFTGK